jgi:hypothetical protein
MKLLDPDADASGPPQQLIHAARVSLRAAVVYATTLSDRFELACAFDPGQLDGIPSELLVHLEAVSDAFQDGAQHTMISIEPELAHSADRIAALVREGIGEPPSEQAR